MFERKLITLHRKRKTNLLNTFFELFKSFPALWTEIALQLLFLPPLRSLLAPQLFLMFDVFKSLVLWEFPFICKWWTFPAMHSQIFQCFQRFLTVSQFVCPSRNGCASVSFFVFASSPA